MLRYFKTYKSVRYNKFYGVLGFIEKICAAGLVIFGIFYVTKNNVFLNADNIDGDISINPFYHSTKELLNTAKCPSKESLSQTCQSIINTYNHNISCVHAPKFSILFPNGHPKDYVDITSTVLSTNAGNYMIAGVENVNVTFEIGPSDIFSDIELVYLYHDNRISHSSKKVYTNTYKTYIMNLLNIANIDNLDHENIYDMSHCSLRVSGVTLKVKTICKNTWPNKIKCYVKAYQIPLAYTMLKYDFHEQYNSTRMFGVRIYFDKVSGTNYYLTLESFVLALVLISKFYDCVQFVINILIQYSLILLTTWYKYKYNIATYDGFMAHYVNQILMQLSDEFTTHDIRGHVNRDEYENIAEINL